MSNSSKIILDLCGGTGCWSKPYKEAGYDVRVITLPEYDVLTYEPPDSVYGVLAAPPCTAFCIASSLYWNDYDSSGFTDFSLKIVNRCFEIAALTNPKFFALENPKGRLKALLGLNPIYSFYQYEFDGLFTKLTYLWGDFNTMIIKGPVNPSPLRMCDCSTSELYTLPSSYVLDPNFSKRAAQRSMYPPAFCRAFFEANQ